MSGLPKDALGPAENSGAFSSCDICQGDGWLAYPTFTDASKTTIRIRKVACPRGCPLANPEEPGVLPDFPDERAM